jgi:hypothetical protein
LAGHDGVCQFVNKRKQNRGVWSAARGAGEAPTNEIAAFESGHRLRACSELSARRSGACGGFRDSLHSVLSVGVMCLLILPKLISQ